MGDMGSGTRKRWPQDAPAGFSHQAATPKTDKITVAKQLDPPRGYDEYLVLLQQRNRLLTKVKMTDAKQLDMERKEKGFALYVNGANAGASSYIKRKTPSPAAHVGSQRQRLTAEMERLEQKLNTNALPAYRETDHSTRSRSAPEKMEKIVRRNWAASSINIQTARGDHMHVHVPDQITGNYSENFEEASQSETAPARTAAQIDDSDSSDSEATVQTKSKTGLSDEDSFGSDTDEEVSEQLLLTIDDVKKLRQSLELSASIRESLSQTTDEESDSEDEIPMETSKQVSAADTIVLQFAPIKLPAHKSTATGNSSDSPSKAHKKGLKNDPGKNSVNLNSARPPIPTPKVLSSVKPATTETRTESPAERSQVLSALASENERIDKLMSEKVNNSVSPRLKEHRVQNPLVNSFMLERDSDMKHVEERVLLMERDQQRELIKSLYCLERAARPSSSAIVNTNSYLQRSASKDAEVHKVLLELITSWGHPKLLGLTEIILLDESNQQINVNSSFVRLDGAKNVHGDVCNLFNNKYRTVKERNMFCCEQASQRPISISFRVQIPLGSQIHKIKIYNYNKSLNDINVGVRRMRISIDDDILYDGDIDKGCGNQVFDYGHCITLGSTDDPDPPDQANKSVKKSAEMWIPLTQTPEPTESQSNKKPEPLDRCKTRLLNRSSLGLDLPDITETESTTKPLSVERPSEPQSAQNKKTCAPLVSKKMAIAMDALSSTSPKPSMEPVTRTTLAEVISPTVSERAKAGSSLATGTPSPSPSDQTKTPRKPPWLENLDKKGESSKGQSPLPDWLQGSKADPLRSSLDEMLDKMDSWDSNSGHSKLKTIFDEPEPQISKGMPTIVASEKEEERYRKKINKEMSSSKASSKSTQQDAQETAASRRRKWQQPVDLEASWSSLDVFEKSHKGRLSMEGDALDEYLNPTTPLQAPAEALPSIQEEENFIIPVLPRGKDLVINIKTTWGDKYYVGLNGIELFADTGEPIVISKITASPRDINVLPEYKNDPRVVSNLIDGVNRTRDDIHMWLAPFTAGSNHFICITFAQPCGIALMRIWNYNKSRIHSYRGARDVEMSLDGKYIFKGEIQRASGGIHGGTEAFGDTILFTTSEEILEAVSLHDGQYEESSLSDEEEEAPLEQRPLTADIGQCQGSRPHTSSLHGKKKTGLHIANTADTQCIPVGMDGDTCVYRAKCVSLNFSDTWGDAHYLGLTGLEVVATSGEAIPLQIDFLDAQPRDLHVLPGYERDDRTLDKLINGVNITVSDEHMWLIPFTPEDDHTLTITFPTPQEIVGLRFWNYNKSPEDTYRGAKTVHLSLDGKSISPPEGFLIRKGPGNCYYDFAQELLISDILNCMQKDNPLTNHNRASDEPLAGNDDDYTITNNMPRGFVYQFHLLSTQSDLYYIGLNGFEFYDRNGQLILLEENNVAAYPDSINVLDGVTGDVRTPDKLINGLNDTISSENMWLAPVLPAVTNRIFVIFDYPQTVSMIKVWNYSKTPARGVKEFAFLVDDLLVYNGELKPAARQSGGILPTVDGPQTYHTILFTHDPKIKSKVKNTVISNKTADQEIQLTNDNKVIASPRNNLKKSADQGLRPKTSVVKRPALRRQ